MHFDESFTHAWFFTSVGHLENIGPFSYVEPSTYRHIFYIFKIVCVAISWISSEESLSTESGYTHVGGCRFLKRQFSLEILDFIIGHNFREIAFASFNFEKMSSSTQVWVTLVCVPVVVSNENGDVWAGVWLSSRLSGTNVCSQAAAVLLPTMEVPTPCLFCPPECSEDAHVPPFCLPLVSLYPCCNKAVCAHTASSWLLFKMTL